MFVLRHVDLVSQGQKHWPIHLYVCDLTIKSDFTILLFCFKSEFSVLVFYSANISFILKP